MNYENYDFIIIGGGAAGFFTAINLAEKYPEYRITILEKSSKLLDKVRISGGGRCNVTHACWEPKELIKYYPRGNKELLGPFHRFMCGDMVAWLEQRGIEVKIEDDGRIFPISNKSQTIIDCFLDLANKFKIEICLSEGLQNFEKKEFFQITTTKDRIINCKKLVIATGGSKSIWNLLDLKNIAISTPVPSLFTFNIKHPIINDLPGVAIENGLVEIAENKLITSGPILITHWGLSGPGILKLSSWAALLLNKLNYNFEIKVNWVNASIDEVNQKLLKQKEKYGKEKLVNDNIFKLPKRLWKNILIYLKLETKNWADLSKKEINDLTYCLSACVFQVDGKSVNKDEFVTSGGIELNQINFKTMECKNISDLYFAGEILNIDALTGGFNFQAAWTTSWIIANNQY